MKNVKSTGYFSTWINISSMEELSKYSRQQIEYDAYDGVGTYTVWFLHKQEAQLLDSKQAAQHKITPHSFINGDMRIKPIG